MLSFDSRRKVVDSLKFGRKQEKDKFNEDFANSMSDLIKLIKLNNQEAKSNGQLEESDTDAIPLFFIHLPVPMCNWQFVSLDYGSITMELHE